MPASLRAGALWPRKIFCPAGGSWLWRAAPASPTPPPWHPSGWASAPGHHLLMPRCLHALPPAMTPGSAALLPQGPWSPVAPGALRGTGLPAVTSLLSQHPDHSLWVSVPRAHGSRTGHLETRGGMAGRLEGLTRGEGPCPSGPDPGGPTAYRCPHPPVPGPTWHPCGPWPLRACQRTHVPSSEGPRCLSGCSWELRSHTHPGGSGSGGQVSPRAPRQDAGVGRPPGPPGDTRWGGAGLPLPTS